MLNCKFKAHREVANLQYRPIHVYKHHTRYPKTTTNAERRKTVVTPDVNILYISVKRLSVIYNKIHELKDQCLPRISAKSWF